MADADDWIMIRKLSTLLALADASDLTYEQVVQDFSITIQDDIVVLVITSAPDSVHEAADYAMKQYIKQFKKEFHMSLVLIWK